MIDDVFVGLLITALGLSFGSFANVVIWRFPRGESLNRPGSHCPSCDTPIRWYDNIPVLSWLVLRGRCRACEAPISIRYPLVELLCGGLWLAVWMLYGTTLRFAFAAAFVYLLVILSFIDIDTMRLPNPLVGLTAAIGAVGVVVAQVSGIAVVPLMESRGVLEQPWAMAAAGLLIGGVIPFAISELYALVRGGQGIGMGDVKLLGVVGIFVGPYVLMALMFGSVIGVASSLLLSRGGGMRRKIPFGPSIAAGAVIVLFAGAQVWSWYLSVL